MVYKRLDLFRPFTRTVRASFEKMKPPMPAPYALEHPLGFRLAHRRFAAHLGRPCAPASFGFRIEPRPLLMMLPAFAFGLIFCRNAVATSSAGSPFLSQ